MTPVKTTLAVVVPAYNEESCLPELMQRLLKLRDRLTDVDLTVLFVNDGSTDRTRELLTQYVGKYPFVTLVNLSRNFGHQVALTAGLDCADAGYVVVVDADLQDPPEFIESLYRKACEGYDVVCARRSKRKGESLFKRITAIFFYRLFNWLCNTAIPPETGDFRIINRKVLDTVKQMKERHRFLRGMIPWVGGRQTTILYERNERFSGTTKYPLRKMLRFAADAIFSFSNTPLRLASYVGFSIALVGLIGGLLVLYFRLFTAFSVPGITAVILTVVIMGGVQIMMLGIVGEYIGRIFEEAKGRPLYVIDSIETQAGETT